MNNIRICKKQQKEFIEWLEEELKLINPSELTVSELVDSELDQVEFIQYLTYKSILQKYKEIIGNDKIMKLELRENMYMRTIYGKIDKIFKLTESYVQGVSQKDSYFIYDKDNIIKVSYNIIDILEVGDYVNGLKVIDIVENDIYISDYYAESYIGIVKVKDIKSIVTHEQMEQMAYKVGE